MEVRDNKGRYKEKSKDITGNRYFRLVALYQIRRNNDKHKHAYWLCQCDCGKTIVVRKDSLESGHAKSCGCYLAERYEDGHLRKYKVHDRKLYRAWIGIKQRCENPNNASYPDYGARGIKVCEAWRNSYEDFCEWSLRNGYVLGAKGHILSIDRKDVNGDYEPSNCRWTDTETQNYNKRCTVRIFVNGEKMTLKEISEKYNIPIQKVRGRYERYKKGRISLQEIIVQDDKQ